MPTVTRTTTFHADRLQDVAAQGALYATESERARTLHPAVVQALTDAGFARHFVPARFGGTTGSFGELLDAVALVGEGCTSAAWCAALQAAHGRLAAHLPEAGRADLWRAGPDVPIAAAVVPPAGELLPVAGGYRLTGRWNLASGVDSAHWVLLAVPEPPESPESPEPPEPPVSPESPEPAATGPATPAAAGPAATAPASAAPASAAPVGRQRIVAVPRCDVTVHDTWHNSGLRGTGSHGVSVDGAFVPAHRTVSRETVTAGLRDDAEARCHRIPYTLVASLMFAAPALGAARGALAAWTRLAAARPAGLQDPTAQHVLARSSAEIDAAGLLLRRAAGRADGAPLEDLPAAHNQRDAAAAVDMLVGAVERLYRHGGARAQGEAEPLQRFWRDLHALAGHGALQWPAAAAAYGRWVAASRIATA